MAKPAKSTRVNTIMPSPSAPLRDQLVLRAAVTWGIPGSPGKGVMVLPSAGSAVDGLWALVWSFMA